MRDVPAIPFDLTKNLIGSLNRTRFPLASLSPVLPATGSRPHRLPPLTGCVTNRIRPVIHSLPTDRRARKTESPCNPARCHEPVGRANRPKPVTPPSTGAHFGPPRALPPPRHFHCHHFSWRRRFLIVYHLYFCFRYESFKVVRKLRFQLNIMLCTNLYLFPS